MPSMPDRPPPFTCTITPAFSHSLNACCCGIYLRPPSCGNLQTAAFRLLLLTYLLNRMRRIALARRRLSVLLSLAGAQHIPIAPPTPQKAWRVCTGAARLAQHADGRSSCAAWFCNPLLRPRAPPSLQPRCCIRRAEEDSRRREGCDISIWFGTIKPLVAVGRLRFAFDTGTAHWRYEQAVELQTRRLLRVSRLFCFSAFITRRRTACALDATAISLPFSYNTPSILYA